MKKIPFLFLTSLIIFAAFVIISLAKNNPSPTTTITIPPTKNTRRTTNSPVTSIPTTALARQNAVTAAPTIDPSACIVTVNGQRYDVTQYQYQHSGGNIFNCGTDMSSIFSSKHSIRYLDMMKAYLIP